VTAPAPIGGRSSAWSASRGYLTVSEIFPLETRAMAIAFFYAISTGLGGTVGPIVFGQVLGTVAGGHRGAALGGGRAMQRETDAIVAALARARREGRVRRDGLRRFSAV
jgi:MFS family permease